MKSVRIVDLARELEVKSRSILDMLSAAGIAEHGASLTQEEAGRIREYFQNKRDRMWPEQRPKIDLSRVKKPGDVLRLVREQKGSFLTKKAQSLSSHCSHGQMEPGIEDHKGRLTDQHNNLDELLRYRAELKNRRRIELTALRDHSLATQVSEIGSLHKWQNEYVAFHIENEKCEQIRWLNLLEQSLRTERDAEQRSLNVEVHFDELPEPKKKQYEQRLRAHGGDRWADCFIRLYTAAEWAIEKWAKSRGLNCIDLNETNLYHPQDYVICGLPVDVKTSISIGRSELKPYYSPDDMMVETIFLVRSSATGPDDRKGHHYIQGVFDARVYSGICAGLQYFTLQKPLLNACYAHPLNVRTPAAPVRCHLDDDVIAYCLQNRVFLSAIFHTERKIAAAHLTSLVPDCHHDFVRVITELMNKDLEHLLPHFFADYLLSKIIKKEASDIRLLKEVVWSIFEPNEDQKKYLGYLMSACEILPDLHCAHHRDERVEEMDIRIVPGPKLILRACCSRNRSLSTTLLAYSRKTGETLVYGHRGISSCDAPGCGCLTHWHDGERVGKRTCPRYGPKSGK